MKHLLNPANLPKKQQIVLFCFLSLLFLIINFSSLYFPIKKSVTYDEPAYYGNGYAFLLGQPAEYWNATGMPVQALNPLVSRMVGQDPNPIRILSIDQLKELDTSSIFGGKFATILVSLILGIYVFWWSRQLYGINAGFLAFSLYIFDPNIIAHSGVVHQNIFECFSLFVATYYFWNFLKFGGNKNTILSLVTFGIAQITRHTAVFLLPIYLILIIGFYHSQILQLIKTNKYQSIIVGLKKLFVYVLLFALTSFLFINIGFSGEKTFTKFGDYEFKSQTLQSLQSSYPILQSIPVPFPYAYLRGLDFGKYYTESQGATKSYLMGKLSSEGFTKYYLITFLYKVPIATQLFILMAVISLVRDRKKVDFWKNEAFLIIPSLFFVVSFSLSTAQLGIRYILMIFPFIFVLCSRLMMGWDVAKLRYRLFILGLLAYLIISNLSYFPHYLSYFNELLVDRKMAYTVLADSNLDWGQNNNYLLNYLEEHPETMYSSYIAKLDLSQEKVFDPQSPQAGKVIIGANELVGITRNPDDFRWIRTHLKPVDQIGYSFLVFEIKPQHLNDIRRSVTQKKS